MAAQPHYPSSCDLVDDDFLRNAIVEFDFYVANLREFVATNKVR